MATSSNLSRSLIAGFLILCGAVERADADVQVNVLHTLGDQQAADIGMNNAGDFVIVWQGGDGSNDNVYAKPFSADFSPVAPHPWHERTVAATGFDEGQPAVTMGNDGRFYVTWESIGEDGFGKGLYSQSFTGSGDPFSSKVQVNVTSSADEGNPAMVKRQVIGAGSIVLWEGRPGSSLDVLGPLPTVELQIPNQTSNTQMHPAVDCGHDRSGNESVMAAWASAGHDGDSFGIFARRWGVLGGSADFQVNTFTTGTQWEPAIACRPDVTGSGNAMIVWESNGQDGDGLGVFGQLVNVDTLALVGTEFQVNTYTGSHQRLPDVAADDDGNFIVVWQSHVQDGSADGIFARRYDSTGTPLGTEFGVNQHTLNGQFRPRVAAAPDGSFVVVWSSVGQDGDGFGVFARRFVPTAAAETVSFTVIPGITATVTTPNEGLISVESVEPGVGEFGNFVYGMDIDAPAATAAVPLVIVLEFNDALKLLSLVEYWPAVAEQLTNVYRNGVAVPDCTGAPGMADPDPCVQSRVFDLDGDLHITVLTSSASRWTFGLGECPATTDPACQTGFAKGRLTVQQDATTQKLIAKLVGGPALEQTDLGNPLAAAAGGTGTIVALCVYDEADNLAAQLYAPTGDGCGADVCWSPIGNLPDDPGGPGSGYKYRDPAQNSDGLKNIIYKGGTIGSSKMIVKAAGPNLPTGITAALAGSTQATVQLRALDGECLSATLTDIKRADATSFKAK